MMLELKPWPHTLSGGSRIPLLVRYMRPTYASPWITTSREWLTADDVLVCVCTGEGCQPVVACRGG